MDLLEKGMDWRALAAAEGGTPALLQAAGAPPLEDLEEAALSPGTRDGGARAGGGAGLGTREAHTLMGSPALPPRPQNAAGDRGPRQERNTAQRRQHRRGALSPAHGCPGERAHPSRSLWGSGGSGASGARPVLPQAPGEEYNPVLSSKLWKETHRRAGGLLLMKRPSGDPSPCMRRAGAQGGGWALGTEPFCGEDTPGSAHVPLRSTALCPTWSPRPAGCDWRPRHWREFRRWELSGHGSPRQ